MAKKNNTNNTNTLPEQEFNFIVSDVRIPRIILISRKSAAIKSPQNRCTMGFAAIL